MKLKTFFAIAIVSACALGSLKALPCNAHPYESTVTEADYVSLEAAEDSYVFPSNGHVRTVSVYGVTKSGERIKINQGVQYVSKDESVVSIYQNSVRVEKQGNTYVIAEYNGMVLEIPVIVEREIDLNALETSLLEEAGCSVMTQEDYLQTINEPKRLPDPNKRTAQQILDKAAAMKNVRWTPTQTFYMWNGAKNGRSFEANKPYYGIPYSQLTQVDDIEFLNKLSGATDFYQNGDVDGKSCPMYGVDCSGYVSFAFGIERMTTSSMITALKNNSGKIVKVGNYNPKSLNKTDVLAAYALLEASNAIVHNGHARLILSNDVSSEQIVVYETNNTLPVVSIYTYDDLWEDRYMPFKLK